MADPSDPCVPAEAVESLGIRMLAAMGTPGSVAAEVAAHLVDADLRGVYSHGCMRLAQYGDWARQGLFDPAGLSRTRQAAGGRTLIDGGDGFGIPTMRLAVEAALVEMKSGPGLAATGVVNAGHTGRIGAFAEQAAEAGAFCIILGGGSGREWPQVVPFGGAKGRLPTNPYAFGLPGGANGPVVLDFATSAGAGGKVYAAQYAGRDLPAGLCVDANGQPTSDPQDYISGGALLPMAGPKGYGMALIAELLGRALLGDVRLGLSWVVITIDLAGFAAPGPYAALAEELLAEIRTCPPAPGFDGVEIPGERERGLARVRLRDGIPFPPATLAAIRAEAIRLDVTPTELDRF